MAERSGAQLAELRIRGSDSSICKTLAVSPSNVKVGGLYAVPKLKRQFSLGRGGGVRAHTQPKFSNFFVFFANLAISHHLHNEQSSHNPQNWPKLS